MVPAERAAARLRVGALHGPGQDVTGGRAYCDCVGEPAAGDQAHSLYRAGECAPKLG